MFQGLAPLAVFSLFIRQIRIEHFVFASRNLGANWQMSDLINLFETDDELARALNTQSSQDKVQDTLEWCRRGEIEILYPFHPWYPREFLKIEEPPLFLSILGRPAWAGAPTISVVGSRNPTAVSLSWMEQNLSEIFTDLELVSVSGGARGIDQKCHSLSLRSDLPTIVMLPSGLKSLYPSELENWRHRVLATGGCFLSQFAPDQEMRKFHFHQRNLLIAQLGGLLLVVEAGRRSGSVMTAHLAMEREKPVCVVPGHPSEPGAQGILDLLFDGAYPVRDVLDLKQIYFSSFGVDQDFNGGESPKRMRLQI